MLVFQAIIAFNYDPDFSMFSEFFIDLKNDFKFENYIKHQSQFFANYATITIKYISFYAQDSLCIIISLKLKKSGNKNGR